MKNVALVTVLVLSCAPACKQRRYNDSPMSQAKSEFANEQGNGGSISIGAGVPRPHLNIQSPLNWNIEGDAKGVFAQRDNQSGGAHWTAAYAGTKMRVSSYLDAGELDFSSPSTIGAISLFYQADGGKPTETPLKQSSGGGAFEANVTVPGDAKEKVEFWAQVVSGSGEVIKIDNRGARFPLEIVPRNCTRVEFSTSDGSSTLAPPVVKGTISRNGSICVEYSKARLLALGVRDGENRGGLDPARATTYVRIHLQDKTSYVLWSLQSSVLKVPNDATALEFWFKGRSGGSELPKEVMDSNGGKNYRIEVR